MLSAAGRAQLHADCRAAKGRRRVTVVLAAVYAQRLMRRVLRISLVVTLVALAAAGGALLAGDRVLRREAPAVRLVYELRDLPTGGGSDAQSLVRELAAALRQRLDRQEMRDVQLRATGDRIEVVAPASVPKTDLMRVLGMGGVLSFHVVVEDPSEPGAAEMLARLKEGGAGPQPQPGDALRWLPAAQDGVSPLESSSGGTSYILVYNSPDRAMTHDDPHRPWSVKTSKPTADHGSSGAAVAFELDRRGAKLFGELTGAHIGKMLAIVLDGHVLSAPRVNSRIEGSGIISGPPGGFTQQQATYLASTLNAGALPARLADEPATEEYLTMALGLSPFWRSTLRAAAIALAVLAALLWCALLLLRRLHPTVNDQQAALRSIGLLDET
jgi:preprotein translocase subunit SecD